MCGYFGTKKKKNLVQIGETSLIVVQIKGENEKKKKSENIGFSGPILQQKKKKKKKNLCLYFFIYNFYFENLIYKWIKQFENQQESDPISQAMF